MDKYIVQAIGAILICGMATLAASPLMGAVISGQALVGIYSATAGYLFGYKNGYGKEKIRGGE